MDQSSLSPKRLFTYTDAATVLGVSQRTVQRYIASGLIHTVSVGPRLRRILPDEMERIIAHGIGIPNIFEQPKQLCLKLDTK